MNVLHTSRDDVYTLRDEIPFMLNLCHSKTCDSTTSPIQEKGMIYQRRENVLYLRAYNDYMSYNIASVSSTQTTQQICVRHN